MKVNADGWPKYPFIVVRYDLELFDVKVLGGKVVRAVVRAGVSSEEVEKLALDLLVANGFDDQLFDVLNRWVTLVPRERE